MRVLSILFSVLIIAIFVNVSVSAANLDQFNNLKILIDSAKIIEADIFAPVLWTKSIAALQEAQRAIDMNKKQKDIDSKVTESIEYVEKAIRASEVGKLTLQEYLPPRTKAREVKAYLHVPRLYQEAESQFIKATEKVEKGDVKGGLKEAEKSILLFNVSEMDAIEVEILGKADKLIEKAVSSEAEKYALSTLDRARTSREKSYALLKNDRYNRTTAVDEAFRAEYEAQHAANIAMSVRSLNRNDQAWEKLMLLYEIQMNRVGDALGIEFLPFDNGPLAAADSMIREINSLQHANENLSKDSEFLTGAVVGQLQSILKSLDKPVKGNDPIAMGKVIEEAFITMKNENAGLQQQLQDSQDQLVLLEEASSQVEAQLAHRVEKEEKFKKAKTILNPSEGEVLFNSSNDVVLRLTGLSFDIGQDKIKDEHMPLLKKVEEVIKLFPYAQIIVEGHTDASGEPSSNMLLSEKRAYAVTQYIRQSLLISADKIKSIGFGMDKPIASNQTKEGRSQNRRIDIIIQM